MKKNYVKELMTTPAITCDYNNTIKEVAEIMRGKNIGFLPVIRKGVLCGVITDRDIVIRGIGVHKTNCKIGKIMTSGDIKYVDPSTPLKEAARIMAMSKIRRLPVLSDGNCVGVITTKNLLIEDELFPFIKETYVNTNVLRGYEKYSNKNPHDSIKASDFPL